jgi:drug/metabolite transporter (DMT)-like permease
MLAGGVGTVAALVVVQLYVLQDTSLEWQWHLFVWGVVVGLLGAVCLNAVPLVVRLRRPEHREPLRTRRRLLIYTWLWLFIGVELGMVAAMFELPWLVIALAIYIVVVCVVTAIILTRMPRGAAR